MQLGSEDHKEKARREFEGIFDRMSDLMRDARSVEFQLKVYFDIKEHSANLNGREYESFAKSNFTAQKPKIDKLIKKVAESKDVEQLQAIRLLADPLAHADYRKARDKIDEYARSHQMTVELSAEKLGERFVEGIRDEAGHVSSYGRLIDWDHTNTIIEDFLLFEHQGYAVASREAFDLAKSNFKLEEVGWLNEILMISKAIKPEFKVPN